MSYREHELEQAYDKLEDQYWELIEYLKEHAPATLEAFKRREQQELEDEAEAQQIDDASWRV
jgi:hypothetical protein